MATQCLKQTGSCWDHESVQLSLGASWPALCKVAKSYDCCMMQFVDLSPLPDPRPLSSRPESLDYADANLGKRLQVDVMFHGLEARPAIGHVLDGAAGNMKLLLRYRL